MAQNQPIIYNLEKWSFEAAEESMCFLRGLLQCVMEAKNINDSCIFDLQWHVITMCGNSSEEIAGRWFSCNLIGQLCLKWPWLQGSVLVTL